MEKPKRERKMVPMYSAEDFFSGKKAAKPAGWMSDPDEPGPVVVDLATLERLAAADSGGKGTAPEHEND